VRSDRPVMVFCYFNDFNAVGLRISGLKDSNFFIFLRVYSFGIFSINDNMIDIPRIDNIEHDLFAFLEAKVDFEATPIIYHTCTLDIIPPMKSYLA
jgi:hypothetical protein